MPGHGGSLGPGRSHWALSARPALPVKRPGRGPDNDLVDLLSTALVSAGGLGAAIATWRVAVERRRRRRAERGSRYQRSRLAALATLLEEAEERLGAARSHENPDELEVEAFDRDSGMLRERYLPVVVQQKVATARRKLHPVSVVAFEVEGIDEALRCGAHESWRAVGDAVILTLRECDTVCRVGSSLVFAVLEDTPELGALLVAERVRGALRRSRVGEFLTVSSGVATYPSHALDAAGLVARAGGALELARSTGTDWLAAPADI